MTGGLRITADEHAGFALESGDRSPVHVDPERAERLAVGEPVVHGVHAVLAALEASSAPDGPRPARIEVRFVKPVLVGERVHVASEANGALRLEADGAPLVVIRLHHEPKRPAVDAARLGLAGPAVDPQVAAELGPRDLVPEHGAIVGPPDVAALAARFPRVAAWLGPDVVAGLASVSRLVGMHRPGARALLTAIDVDLDESAGDGAPGRLGFAVTRVAAGVGRIELAVHGLGVSGRVVAMVASVAVPPTDAELDGRVRPDEFAGHRPLVIGGGRGLGAVLARLVARGGARPLVTYRSDAGAAAATVAAIAAAGGRADALRLDVRDPDAALAELDRIGWDGEQLHYLATPRIFRRHLGTERPGLEDEFAAVYVDAFGRLVRALVARAPGRPLAVGYPSSVAVDAPPPDLVEYARAKARGEDVARRLAREFDEVTVHVRRFPRLETEQTTTFLPVETASMVDELVPFLRAVHGTAPPPRA